MIAEFLDEAEQKLLPTLATIFLAPAYVIGKIR
jgi:hypothetical protein